MNLCLYIFLFAQYDASHPAALGLEGFERKSMAAAEFKELVRRTFHLKLSATEVGALFDFFNAADGEVCLVPIILLTISNS